MCDGVTVVMALRYFSSKDLIFPLYKKIRNHRHNRHTVTPSQKSMNEKRSE
jgi:hypothetical protein